MTTLKNTGTKNQKIIIIPVDALLGKGFSANNLKVKSSVKGCCKRSLPGVGDGPKEKKQKVDAFADDILFKFKRIGRFLGPRAAKGDKEDGVELQQENRRLEKQCREKARKDDQIRVAALASQKSAEAERKKKWEQERKAELKRQRERARLALDQIVKTVEFNDSFQIMEDFYSLILCCPNNATAEVEEGEILTVD